MRRRLLLAFLVLLAGAVALAGPETFWDLTRRPAQAAGTVVMPERFVRRWDPVTIFFASSVGPAEGGPADDVSKIVDMDPAQPGAWRWVDGRTLQFRPADPWPPLSRVRVQAGGTTRHLVSLMAPPIETLPRAGATGLDPVEDLTLTFAEPIGVDVLARVTTIELRPLPGVGSDGATWLDSKDFTVKAMERRSADDRAVYVLELDDPIPVGTKATVHFQLSVDDSTERSFSEVSFSTAEPFRPSSIGCSSGRYPVTEEGSSYPESKAITCDTSQPSVIVEFTARPRGVGPIEGRNLVRFEPAVEDLAWKVSGRQLEVSGSFKRDTLYRVRVAPTALRDTSGRPLEMSGESSLWVTFPLRSPYFRLSSAQGILERLGPQRVPVEGRGHDRVDLRAYSIDPLDRTFWPFTDSPVSVDESTRPPGPGEYPERVTEPHGRTSARTIGEHIKGLGTPGLSRIVDLPLTHEGGAARFGLDLEEHLAFLGGKDRPGHYLVGVRSLDGGTTRSWMRVQVTDLSLTTVEEAHDVRFYVTSVSSGAPVAGATVTLEGLYSQPDEPDVWTTLASGRTRGDGSWSWEAPGDAVDRHWTLKRIVVSSGDDVLVLDPSDPPDAFSDGHWRDGGGSWLQWAWGDVGVRGEKPKTLCHIFTERPVYRPEEPVHIKGWRRTRFQGELQPVAGEGHVVVRAPGGLNYRYPVDISKYGAFYQLFDEKDLPTGTYTATLELPDNAGTCGTVSFKKEAYRIPKFEVDLDGPEKAPLDAPFEVGLTATYYAGGRVAARPVRWQVTQYPATWSPDAREGFLYSSDGRYSRTHRFDATPRLDVDGTTDNQGGATLLLDPTVEPTAQPRTYVVEATVTGADDQTVTATRQFMAVPPFVLGLKVPRYLEEATIIPVDLLAAGPSGDLLEGQQVTVRLLQRQWHSRLQASDFTDGEAKYVTEVVDATVSETTALSGTEPVHLDLPIDEAGVYLVELEARDKLGRVQVVQVDLYAGGTGDVTWDQPQAGVFEVAMDKKSYEPGDRANLVLKSPFSKADALVITEAPGANRYQWVSVRNGAATVKLDVEKAWVPKIPVHVVLMRGRQDPGRKRQLDADLGKPTTLASTTWLTVEPTEQVLDVKLTHPDKALPGQTVPVSIDLRDHRGEPVAGEVTLWLVDAAVLALGTEQRLDPLPDFITANSSYITVKDTRNLVFGSIPYQPMPGGGEGEEDADDEGPLDRATVRKNFQPVPYFEPVIKVGTTGKATVQVPLPDNLTVFKIRAKAVSGPDQFGYGKSEIAVRLPVIAQPALPRFVRPGDTFQATALARVVEGEGGSGTAELRADGLKLSGKGKQAVQLDKTVPTRLAWDVSVPTPEYDDDGRPERSSVTLRVGVERAADKAGDAFEVTLPLQPDRSPEIRQWLVDLSPGQTVTLDALPEKARNGTVRRSVLVSDQPEVVRMAAGLDFMLRYPYGGTEQRLSRARVYIALRQLGSSLHSDFGEDQVDRAVEETLEWLPGVIDGEGLVAYWPGGTGYVWLSAQAVSFLAEAREAGFAVDEQLNKQLVRTLHKTLRSDYTRFVDGESYYERSLALEALAQAEALDESYFSELHRRAKTSLPDAVARIALAGSRGGMGDSPAMKSLSDMLAGAVIVKLFDGKEVYGGLQRRTGRSELILPSEAATLADLTRSLARVDPQNGRLDLMVDALVTLGTEDGWGSTQANQAAILALVEWLHRSGSHSPFQVLVGEAVVKVGADEPTGQLWTDETGELAVRLEKGKVDKAILRADLRWLPVSDGSHVQAHAAGFVVTRTLERVDLSGGPTTKLPLDEAATTLDFKVGDVVEDHVAVTSPDDRYHVAITIPLAAGMEPMNPALATAPPEARPTGRVSTRPSYTMFLDDRVVFFYDRLPKGTHDFYFRTRASVPGSFVQPAAQAEQMYKLNVRGNSPGARVDIARAE